jgi:hypothetical protein
MARSLAQTLTMSGLSAIWCSESALLSRATSASRGWSTVRRSLAFLMRAGRTASTLSQTSCQ